MPTAGHKSQRAEELEEMLDQLILKIMINLSQSGYQTEEIMDAMDAVCLNRRKVYSTDHGDGDRDIAHS